MVPPPTLIRDGWSRIFKEFLDTNPSSKLKGKVNRFGEDVNQGLFFDSSKIKSFCGLREKIL
jgi:hypothetical protein